MLHAMYSVSCKYICAQNIIDIVTTTINSYQHGTALCLFCSENAIKESLKSSECMMNRKKDSLNKCLTQNGHELTQQCSAVMFGTHSVANSSVSDVKANDESI